jgi:hypothetical protein
MNGNQIIGILQSPRRNDQQLAAKQYALPSSKRGIRTIFRFVYIGTIFKNILKNH